MQVIDFSIESDTAHSISFKTRVNQQMHGVQKNYADVENAS